MRPGARAIENRPIAWEHGPLALLCVAAFLGPLIGGTVSVEPAPLEPGYVPTVRAIFGGSELPVLSHFVIALLAGIAAAWAAASRRVLQVPMIYFGVAALMFFGFVAVSVLFSSYPASSFPAAIEWAGYAMALFAAVAISGRQMGPFALASALFAGCVLLSWLGVVEYLFGTNDPTWRIFATWQNPNALAGMLLIGAMVGIGLTMSFRKWAAALCGGGVALIFFALALTQSKGAYLAGLVGLVAILVLTLAWLKGKAAMPLLGRLGLCLVALVGLLALLKMRPLPAGTAGSAAPLARVSEASTTQEQSSGFRSLLWKGALSLIKSQPQGYGIGTYRYESARPGLTTQTHLAHNSYLQLGAEAGVIGLIAFVAMGGIWLYYALKGARHQNAATTPLKIGLLGAVIAAGAHNVVDSDLYYFGTGFAFFLLMGLVLQLNTDGVTPESVQPAPRWIGFSLAILIPLGLLFFGAIEATKTHIRWHLVRSEVPSAQAGIDAIRDAGLRDGDIWYLQALIAPDAKGRLEALQQAAALTPTPKHYRALGRILQDAGQPVEAAASLKKALAIDPNNLPTLKALLDLYIKTGNDAEAAQTAQRLIEVESKPYFTVRALPELVPTETYFGRIYLAKSLDGKAKAEMLEPAFRGFLEYSQSTVPNVINLAKAGADQSYGGETKEIALDKLQVAQEVAKDLAAAYRVQGDAERAEKVEKDAATLEVKATELSMAAPPPSQP